MNLRVWHYHQHLKAGAPCLTTRRSLKFMFDKIKNLSAYSYNLLTIYISLLAYAHAYKKPNITAKLAKVNVISKFPVRKMPQS